MPRHRPTCEELEKRISELEKENETLINKQVICNGILESQEFPIFAIDRQFCYLSFNKAHEAGMKTIYNADIEIGNNLLDYQSVEEDKAAACKNFEKVLAGENIVIETYAGEESDKRLYFEIHHNPLLDKYGNIIGIVLITIDISARKQSELALTAKTDELDRFFTLALDLLCIADTSGYFRRVNKSWETVLGYSGNELENKRFLDFVHPDDLQKTSDAIKELENGEKILSFTNRYRSKDGNYQWIEWRSIPFENKLIYAAAHDITEKKYLEDTLMFLVSHSWIKTGEDFFRALARYLADSMHMDYVCIDQLEGDLLYARTLAIYYDGRFDENVTYTLKDTPCGDVVGKTICCFPNGVYQLFPQDAILQDIKAESYIGTTLWDSKGKPIGLIAIIGKKPIKNTQFSESSLEIVAICAANELERRISENALIESEKNYRMLFNEMIDGFALHEIITDENGKPFDYRFLSINPAFERLTGLKAANIIGKTELEVLPNSESYWADMYGKVALTGESLKYENYSVELNKYYKVVAFSPKKGYFATIFEDITDQVIANNELKSYSEKLKEANETKDMFFSIIAHDLKNPFNTILGLSKLLSQNIRTYNVEKSEKFALEIHHATQSALDLLENLLLWAKSQSRGIDFNPVHLVLKDILKETFLNTKYLADYKEIEFIYFLGEDISLYADQNMLNTILRNLVNNAIKFTRSGGRIELYAMHFQDNIEITVSDTGTGIKEDILSKLFEKSINSTQPGTALEKGTGLGLILCKQFVEKHGGTIWAESAVGKGTEFKFTIPVKKF